MHWQKWWFMMTDYVQNSNLQFTFGNWCRAECYLVDSKHVRQQATVRLSYEAKPQCCSVVSRVVTLHMHLYLLAVAAALPTAHHTDTWQPLQQYEPILHGYLWVADRLCRPADPLHRLALTVPTYNTTHGQRSSFITAACCAIMPYQHTIICEEFWTFT